MNFRGRLARLEKATWGDLVEEVMRRVGASVAAGDVEMITAVERAKAANTQVEGLAAVDTVLALLDGAPPARINERLTR